MLKNLMTGAAALALSVTAMSGAANAGLIIDDFSTPLGTAAGYTINDAAPGSVFDRSFSPGILGGDRELELARTNTSGFVSAIVEDGHFSHANGAGATGTSLLRWDGSFGGGSETDGRDYNLGGVGAGINLASFGNAFHLTVISADTIGSDMELRLYTSATLSSIATISIPVVSTSSDGNPLDNSPFEFYFSLAAILAGTSGPGGAADLTDIRAIEWYAEGQSDFDATIDIVEIVPEPASLTLLGAGIMGLGYFGRRNRKA